MVTRRSFLSYIGSTAFPLVAHSLIEQRGGDAERLQYRHSAASPPTIRSPVLVSAFCSGNGANEDAGFSRFITQIVAGGLDGIIDLPVRLAAPKNVTGYAATLRSTGEGKLIFSGGTDGLIFDNSALLSSDFDTLGLEGLVLHTETDGLGTGLQVRGSAASGDNLVPSLHVEELEVRGVDTATGWKKGVIFDCVRQSRISGTSVRGRTELAPGCMEAALEFINGCNVVEINNLNADWGECGVIVRNAGTFSEGIRWTGGFARAMKWGFIAEASGQYHMAKGVHFDTTRGGVLFGSDGVVGSDFSSIEDCFFLRSAAEPWGNAYAGIAMNSNYGAVANNRIFIDGERDRHGNSRQHKTSGIVIGSAKDGRKSGRTAVMGNVIVGPEIPIHLHRATRLCNVKGNSIDAFGNKEMVPRGILNGGGSSNDLEGNLVEDAWGHITRT